MAIDPNKKFLYINRDTTIDEMDEALCFPVSSFIGAETQASSFLHLYFKGSKGTDATIVKVNHESFALIKTFYKNLVDEINFGENAFINIYDHGRRNTFPSDVSFRMDTATQPTFTTQDADFIVGGDSLTFDSVQLTGIQTSSETFADNDVSLMTAGAIADACLTFDEFGVASRSASHNVSLSSTTSGKPVITIANFNTDAVSPEFIFQKYDTGADGDDLGRITFKGDDDGDNVHEYAQILGEIADATGGQEAGRLSLKVAEFDGTVTTGLLIDGDTNANGEVDVTIAAGTASDTTIAGNLAVTTALTLGGHAVNDIDLAGEFVDSDEHLMTSAAIEDKILSYGYSTTSGDMTGVTISVGSGLDISESNTTGGDYSATINLDLTEVGVSGSANQILTDDGDGTVTSEANLTWDNESLTIQSSDTNDPLVKIKSTGGAAHIGGALQFITDEGAAGASGDILGRIEFVGDNADQDTPQQTYAKIFGKVDVATDGEESGILELQVANHDDDLGTGLTLTGGSQNDEIDVTIGLGTDSVTTVAGTLTMGSTAAMTNAGQLSVAAQPNITTMTGVFTGSANQLLTDDGDGTVTSESDVTYDSGAFSITSATGDKPSINLTATGTAPGKSANLNFIKDAADTEDDELLGVIAFMGEDEGNNNTTFANIQAAITESDETDEAGQLTIQVATSDGTTSTSRNALFATGSPSADDVDVTIGHGSTSTTTVAGNLSVNGTDHTFTSSTDNKPIVTLSCGGTAQVGAQLTFKRTATGADNTDIGTIHFEGKNEADEDITYAKINVDTADASDGAEEGQMLLLVASHDGELQPGLNIISGNLEDEVDATIGNGSASVVTIPGFASIGGHAINDIDVAGEFVDSDEHLMTSAAIDDRINAAAGGVTADPFSTTVIKVLPNQWIINDDVGRPLFVEDDTSNTLGVRCVSTTDEMYAWQKLPTGYKATPVKVFASASTSNAVTARSYNYTTGADNAVSESTGDLNTNIDITDIPSSATQDLVIKVSPASASTIIYGATVVIATI